MLHRLELLQAGIPLLALRGGVVLSPLGASRLELREIHGRGNLGDALEELKAETLAGVPGDVAVEEPRAGVIDAEGKYEPAPGGKQGGVTAGGVVPLEPGEIRRRGEVGHGRREGVRGRVGVAEDVKVVTLFCVR